MKKLIDMKQIKRFTILISGIILLSVFACEGIGNDVEYIVESDKSGFDVTYESEGGGTAQETVYSTSWSYSLNPSSGDFLYISAQTNHTNAEITVRIEKGSNVLEETTSSGDYVIATASTSY